MVYNFTVSAHPYKYLLSFDLNQLNKCEVIAHCGFDLHFPDEYDAEHILICQVTTSVCPWWKNIHCSSLSVLKWVCLFFAIELGIKFFYILDTYFLTDKLFVSVSLCELTLSFLDYFLSVQKEFYIQNILLTHSIIHKI